jgi:predicted nucleic-acid-binding protein
VIGLDTNVLVRYIAQDDPVQSPLATAFIENECSAVAPGWVAAVVLVELVWVCETCYGATRPEIIEILGRILSSRQLQAEDADTAWKALRLFQSSKADFSDCLILTSASVSGCARVMTFDKLAAQAGMELLRKK